MPYQYAIVGGHQSGHFVGNELWHIKTKKVWQYHYIHTGMAIGLWYSSTYYHWYAIPNGTIVQCRPTHHRYHVVPHKQHTTHTRAHTRTHARTHARTRLQLEAWALGSTFHRWQTCSALATSPPTRPPALATSSSRPRPPTPTPPRFLRRQTATGGGAEPLNQRSIRFINAIELVGIH